jgi:hypothetical protein
MRSLIIIAVALSLSIATGRAQTSEPATPPPAPAPAEASIHGYGDRDKTCLAWSDTCRSCERGADETIVCSNIAIACQPAAITCSSRRSDPAK